MSVPAGLILWPYANVWNFTKKLLVFKLRTQQKQLQALGVQFTKNRAPSQSFILDFAKNFQYSFFIEQVIEISFENLLL